MPNPSSSLLSGIKTPLALALTLLLCVQAFGYYFLPKTDVPMGIRPLSDLPRQIGPWQTVREMPMEQAVQEVLKSDDSVNRFYSAPGESSPASLFIAFFKSQRSGASPHSPKNCLPGSGWASLSQGFETLDVPGYGPLTVNRYLVARGDERTVVYYWYQSAYRAVASEYWAKIWLVLDSIRYRRSDTSLVRVVVPSTPGIPTEQTDKVAKDFILASYPVIREHLPH